MEKRHFLLSLIALLMGLQSPALAQGTAGYFTLCDDATSGTRGMTIKAILDIGASDWANVDNIGRYQVGAFVEGECHAIAIEGENRNVDYWIEREDHYNWFVLNLTYTSARSSKDIVFKLYNSQTGVEYTLKSDTQCRTIGVNYGSDSKPIKLSCVEAKDMWFTDFEMTMNSMVDLSSKLKFSPENATCPNNINWEVYPSTYTLKSTGNGGYQFTPTAAGTYSLTAGTPGRAFLYFREGRITVKQPTNYVYNISVNPGYETIEVDLDDKGVLMDLLGEAFKVTYWYPEQAPDEEPIYESSNTRVVAPNDDGDLEPVGKGTTTITAKVLNKDGSVRKSASLTCVVTVSLQGFSFRQTSYTVAPGGQMDMAAELVPTPADATLDLSQVRWAITQGSSDVATIDENGLLTAKANGTVQVTAAIASAVGSLVEASTWVTVEQAVTGLKVNTGYEDIYVVAGDSYTLTTMMNAAVSLVPEGATAYIGWKVEDESVVSYDGRTFLPMKSGITKATAYVGEPEAPSFTATVTIHVTPQVEGISLPETTSMSVDETLDLCTLVTAVPEGAVLDKDRLSWTVDEGQELVSLRGNNITALAIGQARLTATLTVDVPSAVGMAQKTYTASTLLYIGRPATALAIADDYREVTVNVGQSQELTDLMKKALIVTPANATSDISWHIDDETIVDWARGWFQALKKGTTKATAYIGDWDNPTLKAGPVTIHIVQPATGIAYKERGYALNVGEKLNLRDEIEITPPDADVDKTQLLFTVTAADGSDASIVSIADGVLTALQPGTLFVTATLAGTQITASMQLDITQPATALNVSPGYESVTVNVGETTRLTDFMAKAVTILPANTTDYYYWHIDDESIVEKDRDGNFIPKKAGTTKATAYVGSSYDAARLKATVTITVLPQSVGIALKDVGDIEVKTTLVLNDLVSPVPADAAIDKSKVQWTVERGESLVKIADGKLTAMEPGYVTLTASLTVAANQTFKATTYIRIHRSATALTINEGHKEVSVYVGENQKLTELMAKAYTVTPANTSDEISWTVDDSNIADWMRGDFYANKKGSTNAYVYATGPMHDDIKAGPVKITVLQPATAISFDARGYSLNVGEKLTLADKIELTPADADLDKATIVYTASKDGLTSISGGILQALAPGSLVITANVPGTTLKAEVQVDIYQPATALNVNPGHETITVNVGETTRLTDFMAKAVTILPENTTDSYYWRIEDESIVEKDRSDNFIPKKAGTTKAIAYVGDKDAPRLKAEVSITVKPLSEGIQLPPSVDMNVGDAITLSDLVTVVPADAAFDKNTIVWSVEQGKESLVTIAGGKLTAKEPGSLKLSATVTGSTFSATTIINIYQPATALKLNDGYREVTVNLGENDKLTGLMAKAVTVTPANSTDEILWTIGDTEIVKWADNAFSTLKKGTTTATAHIDTRDGKQLSAGPVTIHVLQPAKAISYKERGYAMNVGQTMNLRNEIDITPADADVDKTQLLFSVTAADGSDASLVTIDDGVLTALQPGTLFVTASLPGTTLTASMQLDIYQPATTFEVKPGFETITVNVGETDRLTDLLSKAITILPDNTTDSYNWHIDDESIVEKDRSGNFIPMRAGTTKATAYIGQWAQPLQTAELTIVVKPLTEGLQMPATLEMNVGEQLELTDIVSVVPEDSPLDKSTIVWTVEQGKESLVDITRGLLTAMAPGNVRVTATVPGTLFSASTLFYIFQPAVELSVNRGYETITVTVGDTNTLTEKMQKAVTILPANTTDDYMWTVADQTIVAYDGRTFSPVKEGTTTATAYVGDADSPRLSATVTIVVEKAEVPPVKPTAISLPQAMGMNVGEQTRLLPLLTVTPADAVLNDGDVEWKATLGELDAVKIENGVMTARKPGFVDVEATVKGTQLKATMTVWVYQPAKSMTVREGYETITVEKGDATTLTQKLKEAIVITPENHTDMMKWTIEDNTIVEQGKDTWFTPLKAGKTQLKATLYGRDEDYGLSEKVVVAEVSITVMVIEKAVTFTFPDVVMTNNRGGHLIQLTTTPADAELNRDLFEIEVEQGPYPEWGPAARLTFFNLKDHQLMLYGEYVGEYTYSIKYAGQQMLTDKGNTQGRICTSATYDIGNQWKWRSFFAVPQSGSIALTEGDGSYLQAFDNGEGRLVEIRTRDSFLHYDPQYGYFGPLKELKADDGMFKTRGQFEDYHSYHPLKLTAGYKDLLIRETLPVKPVRKGANWVAYPHELGHNARTLVPYLTETASEGDIIYSQDNFMEFDGEKWRGTDYFWFEPGDGYAYYTSDETPKTINWGPFSLPPEEQDMPEINSRLLELPSQPDMMPIVATLGSTEGAEETEGAEILNGRESTTVLAMVGGEVRGVSKAVGDGLLHIAVRGQAGEEVTLVLADDATGRQLPLEQHFTLDARQGTHKNPVALSINPAVAAMAAGEAVYDLQGRRMESSILNPKSSTQKRGVYIVNGKKYVK